MRRAKTGLASFAAILLAVTAANAQGTVKIGLICPFSGQFADTAAQMENGIKLYVKEHGDTVAGKKIEFVRKDTGGIAPDVAKRLAQELVVRDKVDILACFALTPNALAVGDVSAQAKKFMVNMNAATSIITTKSPYMVRTSFTVPQVNEALGTWAYKSGARKAYTLVSDFSPGHDGEGSFQRAFKEAGGEIIGSARYPVANQDFTAFLQRAKDLNPDVLYIWVPGGPQPAAIGKAVAERGIDLKKTKVVGQGELTFDEALKGMGDAGLGFITAFHYDHNHQSPTNKKFVATYNADY
jgi:branched-chain amino acid transport system substrate-binding protein